MSRVGVVTCQAPTMATTKVTHVMLNSGQLIPTIGFGTGALPMPPPEQLTSIFIEAIEAGYRHFDTAASYGTEECVGRAVAAALDRGLIKSRNEVFVTSKLSIYDTHHDLVLPALKETLREEVCYNSCPVEEPEVGWTTWSAPYFPKTPMRQEKGRSVTIRRIYGYVDLLLQSIPRIKGELPNSFDSDAV
ncbi:methylecgonone reductase-like [Olea europaea var. sylvestris]|uniref:methylecgonone reductase-like n=1 Tax=Olea europaea var. sylvestris TaxID=158386 RepID=UPI000C1D4D64|nr:methylecgonone reductase-like [Olea europaea var. sylvestris]